MRIGIVTTWFERGAAYVSKQFKQILEQENEVYIYARGGEDYAIGNPNWDGDRIWWGKRRISPFHLSYIDKKDFIKWVRQNNIELVIFNEQRWYMPLLWCKELRVKTVAYVDYYTHDTIPLFNIYDALICNTKRHKLAFEKHPNAYYIPWGTDTDLYKPVNENLVDKGIVTIFHSAGMNGYRKGTDLLIKAYLKSKQCCKLIIHTQKELEEQFPECSDALKVLQSEGKLKLIEETVTAPGLYYKGDVYIYPSRLEGIGLTIAEAISSGLVCIVPNNAPMNEFVSEDVGFTIPIVKQFCREDGYYWPMCEIDVNELANLIDYCSDNMGYIELMKKKARIYAINNLSQKTNFQGLLDIVKEVRFGAASSGLVALIRKNSNRGLGKFEPLYMMFYPVFNAIRRFLA